MGMGENIKALRIERGWTQEELGKRVGVQKSAIAKYENGVVTNMKRSVIQKMSELFGVSPSYLMGLKQNAGAPVSEEYPQSTVQYFCAGGNNPDLDFAVSETVRRLFGTAPLREKIKTVVKTEPAYSKIPDIKLSGAVDSFVGVLDLLK